jgi:hypothetical protein
MADVDEVCGMKRFLKYAVLLALLAPAPALADELTFISCGMMGRSDYFEPYEKGPVFMFSFAVRGLKWEAGGPPVESELTTVMIADRHKIFGAGEMTKGLSMKGGVMLTAILPDKRLVNLIVVPSEQSGAFSAQMFGLYPEKKESWLDLKGLCQVTKSPDGRIPAHFYDAMYPLIEKSASDRYAELERENEGKKGK